MNAAQTCNIDTSRPLRLQAAILNEEGHVVHTLKFDWNDLNERWAFTVRMQDVLNQGFGVALAKVDPKAERLAKKFKTSIKYKRKAAH